MSHRIDSEQDPCGVHLECMGLKSYINSQKQKSQEDQEKGRISYFSAPNKQWESLKHSQSTSETGL